MITSSPYWKSLCIFLRIFFRECRSKNADVVVLRRGFLTCAIGEIDRKYAQGFPVRTTSYRFGRRSTLLFLEMQNRIFVSALVRYPFLSKPPQTFVPQSDLKLPVPFGKHNMHFPVGQDQAVIPAPLFCHN